MNQAKREYLQTLRRENWKFSNKYKVHLDYKFDPMRWLRSYQIGEIKLDWPSEGGVYEMWYKKDIGECNSFDFWFCIPSMSNAGSVHKIRMNLSRTVSWIPGNAPVMKFYPSAYEHSCDDTFSIETSYGFILHCKHLYATLREVDKIRNKFGIGEIPLSSFVPSNELLAKFSSIDREKTVASKEKLEKTFSLLEQNLHLNELLLLATLNKRISYLKKS